MDPAEFRNVTFKYQTKVILDNISFKLEENKITAILGKSGSGKSTILQLMNGLLKPASGDIKLFREDINYNKINELRHRIGYSVQGTLLFPHLNIYDNITLLAKILNKPKNEIDERVDKIIELVNLDQSFLKKFPFQLSGGEQQRVGICRAIMLNPETFLLDEAFGALDFENKKEIHSELLKLQKAEPRTIFIVTHDIYEAEKLADNVIFIEEGRITYSGNKNEFNFSKYHD
ncbi:ABC transporter ATP-binding protein [soil metagenome]